MLNQVSSKYRISDKKNAIFTNYDGLDECITASMNLAWKLIAPVWPLQSYIARNPLVGLEDVPFVEALNTSSRYFGSIDIHRAMNKINQETIKWCQALFGENQATIAMPLNGKSLFIAWKNLAIYDRRLHSANKAKIAWLKSLPDDPILSIVICLKKLAISRDKYAEFFRLLLVTLPGWAGYVKYIVNYSDQSARICKVEQHDYLAIRLAITCLLWSRAADILKVELKQDNAAISQVMSLISNNETNYRRPLIKAISTQLNNAGIKRAVDAQFIFCIDVRSEPYRRSIESQGNYETYGYAGFFGVPVSMKNYTQTDTTALCPVLIKPKHVICESVKCNNSQLDKYNYKLKIFSTIKKLYKSMKYGFTTPFLLVEILGPIFGFLTAFKTLNSFSLIKTPNLKVKPHNSNIQMQPSAADIQNIDFDSRCQYAKNALYITGLTDNFAPIIFLCGHRGAAQNNPYASALDCGACGGNKGGFNAQILAKILNDENVRIYLKTQNICVPDSTRFIAAEHNTTTDDMEIFQYDNPDAKLCKAISKIKNDLIIVKNTNAQLRSINLNVHDKKHLVTNQISKRSTDWSQTRPEWGLAKNAAFIIAPRSLTANIDLGGRAFLHSYNWEHDTSGSSLEVILTAPMVVAQWINSQYLFSTINNRIYGSGSKVTQNITGKFGVIQGNASDLMHGLPVQSVFDESGNHYHEALRMLTIVYAPKKSISDIIAKHILLQNLFSNNWISLIAIDPLSSNMYSLTNELSWEIYQDDL
jgi:uncharacterized protein YbcC (UPF0753/DUF2309 family)